MTCEELNGLLDALMDDELTAEQRQAMTAHAQSCPECASAVRSALQLKALFAEMPPEVDVPLAAQAKWRGAVREAAAKQKRQKLLRWIGSAAAAVVVLVGVGLALNLRGAPRQETGAALMAAEETAGEAVQRAAGMTEVAAANAALVEAADYAEADSAVIEADGALAFEDDAEAIEIEAEEAVDAGATPKRAPACELSLRVADVDTACSRIGDLVQEYEGRADTQRREDGGANLYVELAANDAGDFISAVMPLDESGQAVKAPPLDGDGTVLVLIAVHAAN